MSDEITELVKRLRSYLMYNKYIITEDIYAAAATIEALRAERDRLSEALRRCYPVGCSQVKEIVTKTFSSLPISKCECKIEMGTFRARGAHCPVCGGVIGKDN